VTRDPSHGRFTVVPASYVYLLRDGTSGLEVLLQLRQNTGYLDDHWAAAAAGHVERGETAYDAAHREALEELGVTELDLMFFTACSWAGEPRIVEPEKAAALQWCALDDLPDPVVPHERTVLEALRTGTATAYSTFGF
jgi:8-oxo-dGTP diphosphatase